jgi:hypothetical protein
MKNLMIFKMLLIVPLFNLMALIPLKETNSSTVVHSNHSHYANQTLGPGQIRIRNISGNKANRPAKTMRFLVFNFGDNSLLVAAADITLKPGESKIVTLNPKITGRAMVSVNVSQPNILGADNRLNPRNQAGVEFGKTLEYDGVTSFTN